MKLFFQKYIFLLIGVVLSVSLLSAGYFYYQYHRLVSDTAQAETMQNKQLVKTLGTFMELPEETPEVITITDRDRLQGQMFFQKAENGDKILIYTSTRRIILYRPRTKRVIDVAPLVFNEQETVAPSPDPLLP